MSKFTTMPVQVSLRVDLRDVVNPVVNVEEEEVEFSAVGKGAHGEQRWAFIRNTTTTTTTTTNS